MAKQLTIRGVPDEVERRLEIISREKQQSIKATVVGCLESAVGSEQRRAGLSRYATWTERDRLECERALAQQRSVDDADWRS
jgi:plasmid stability protein